MLGHEREFLGALLQKPELIDATRGEVGAAEFSNQYFADIYREILRRHDAGEPTDAVSIGEALGQLETVYRVARDVFTTEQTPYHAQQIRKAARARRMADDLAQASRELRGGADPDEVGARVAAGIEESAAQGGGGYQDFCQLIAAGLEAIDEAANRRSDGGTVGVPTGIQAIDERTGGLQAPRLIVLAARPSIGKTALANQIALHAAGAGFPVGVASLEMGPDELAIRSLANHHGLNGSALTFGDEREICRLTDCFDQRLKSLPLFVDTETFALDGIVARLAEWRRKHGIQLAIIDHIGLIEAPGANPVERLGKISRALKVTAKRLDIAVLAVSQLNRRVETEKRRPILADLRDSGAIEQDCDIAIFLHVDESSEGLDIIPVEVGLLKNRQGRKGWLPSPLYFEGRTQRFTESPPGAVSPWAASAARHAPTRREKAGG
jgi:replicative DNA helicase